LKENFQRFLKRKKPVEFDWLFLVAGTDLISNFLEGYELVVDLWMLVKREQD
jgi:hypothetical protein